MTEIKTKISNLRELCQLVSLEGKDVKGKSIIPVPEFQILAEGGNLRVQAKNKGNQLALELNYKAETPTPGIIVIGDVERFLKYLDRFNSSDTVTLKTTENKLILTRDNPLKVARIPQASGEILEGKDASAFLERFKKAESGYFETPKMKFGVKLTLKAEDVKSVIDDGEAVNQRVYPWTFGNAGLRVKVGSEQSGEIETVIEVKKIEAQSPTTPEVKTAYAYGIDNIFGNLTGEVIVNLASGGTCPMIVEKNVEQYSLKIILAPMEVVE